MIHIKPMMIPWRKSILSKAGTAHASSSIDRREGALGMDLVLVNELEGTIERSL